MHLAAMVDVVQEEMSEQVADTLRDMSVFAAIRKDAPVKIFRRQPFAEFDQPAVEAA